MPTTPTVAQRYLAATEQAEDASQIIHDFANGDSTTTVATGSGAIPTLSKFIADQTAAMTDAIDEAIVNAGLDSRVGVLETTATQHGKSLRSVLSVGAKGDGLTDDTAAFQQCRTFAGHPFAVGN